jgi:cysteine synthase
MSVSAPSAVDSALGAIGNTPIVRLSRVSADIGAAIYLKLEWYNPTASYKDRMALAMIEGAETRGLLRPGMKVVEYSGGSTGSSLAFVCAVKGYPLRVVTSDAFAQEKLRTMRAFGAELEVIPSRGGRITPDLVPAMVERAKELASREDVYFTDQFRNPDVARGYEALGREVALQVPGPVHTFCAGVGSGGMLVGAATGLRETHPTCRVVALEPASAPLITQGRTGTHSVEGIGVGFVPPLLEEGGYDDARAVDEEIARATARELARHEGIFAGTSSGLNVAAAIDIARELGPEHNVVTVAVDSGLKYLAGELYG